MIRRVLKIAIVVLVVYAFMNNPTEAAHNVARAGDAGVRLLTTLADRMGQFLNALMT
jgi:hypothetical protein